MPEGLCSIDDQKFNSPTKIEDARFLPPKITDKHIFFFGWEGPHPEVCLQQWFPSPFNDPEASGGYDDEEDTASHTRPLKFHTAEQYMMYWKALLMGDDEMTLKIADCKTPAEAKALGKEVRNVTFSGTVALYGYPIL